MLDVNYLGDKARTLGTTKGTIRLSVNDVERHLHKDSIVVEITYAPQGVKTRKQLRLGQSSFDNCPDISKRHPDNLFYTFLSNRKTGSYSGPVNEDTTKIVSDKLTNLSVKIDSLLSQRPKRNNYEELCEEIIGFVVSTKIKKDKKVAVQNFEDDTNIELINMGEGIPNLLGLITKLCTANNKIFVIEELENDLHPKQLRKLLRLIIEKSEENQFFISTHSNIVLKLLGGVQTSKIFKVHKNKVDGISFPLSELKSIPNEPTARLEVLHELGYQFMDLEMWNSWLILEESSAEVIIRNYLIPWFVPELKDKLRTYSAKSTSSIKRRFEELTNMFVFLHLTKAYTNKVWVVIDDGDKEAKIIKDLKDMYMPSGWNESQFQQFSNHDFEIYYPKHFTAEVQKVLQIPKTNDQKRRQEKAKLINKVKEWLNANPDKGRVELEESAGEVINVLKNIKRSINGCI